MDRAGGGLPITGYNVSRGPARAAKSGTPVNGSSLVTTTGYKVTGLVNGTTYYFMVTAFNRSGQGPTSNEANAVPVTVPGEPTGLTATAGDGTVTLVWAAPASDGGSPVTGYNVYQGTSPGGESGTPVNGSSLVTATTYQVTGLTNGTTYYFMVPRSTGLVRGRHRTRRRPPRRPCRGRPPGWPRLRMTAR